MFCSYCGNQITDDSAFCRFCGKAVQPSSVTEPSIGNGEGADEAAEQSEDTTPAAAVRFNPFGAIQGAAAEAARAAGGAANAAAEAVGNAAETMAGTIADVAGVASSSAKQVHQMFGGEYGDVFVTNLKDEAGSYIIPDPVIDEREFEEVNALTQRYQKLLEPNALAKTGKAISEAAPAPIKDMVRWVGKTTKDTVNGLTKVELISGALDVANEGFKKLEEYAALTTVGRDYVLQRMNHGKQTERISSLKELCLLRSYDVASIAQGERLQHIGMAFMEGGGTGAAGFAGLAPNLALSMFLYFRAVQSVAMFYGYDVKADNAEMVIASEVFARAMSLNAKGNSANDYIGKILIYAESSAIGTAAKKTWTAVIQTGGAGVLIAQMRALSNAAARKALQKNGERTLENRVFSNALARIGEKLTLKNITMMVPIVGAGFGALFDTAQMNKVLDFADLFYHKRFILDKPERIERLTGQELPAEEPREVSE